LDFQGDLWQVFDDWQGGNFTKLQILEATEALALFFDSRHAATTPRVAKVECYRELGLVLIPRSLGLWGSLLVFILPQTTY